MNQDGVAKGAIFQRQEDRLKSGVCAGVWGNKQSTAVAISAYFESSGTWHLQ
jgi:hypothetical protein